MAAHGRLRRIRRGQQPGALTRTQELGLINSLREAYPGNYALAGQLWTRQSVADLIQRRYGIRLTDRCVGRYLKSWGLGPRTPIERACTLCADAVARWLVGEYQTILRTARSHGAEVCWAGRGRLYGVDPPAVLASAVSGRSGLRFAIRDGHTDGLISADFLPRLAEHEGRRVHVILDGSWTTADLPRRLPAGIALHTLPTCARTME